MMGSRQGVPVSRIARTARSAARSLALALALMAGCTSPLERGERLYREGDTGGALRVWRAVPENDGSFEAVRNRLRIVEEEFARLLRRYEKQAAFFESEGRLGEAVLYYRLAYKLDPDRKEILSHVQGLIRELDRQVHRERVTLKAALETGDLPRAHDHARRLERLDPFDPENQIEARQVHRAVEKEAARSLRAGKLAYAAGNRAAAQRSFERVLRLDPTNETARGYLSYLRKLEGPASPAQASAPVPSAISEEQAVAEGHLRSGQEAEAEGELFRALAEYEAALRVDPKHRTARRARDALRETLRPGIAALYEEGKRYFQDEDLHNALRVWRNVLLIDPEDVRTRENVDRAERLLARLEEIQTDATR